MATEQTPSADGHYMISMKAPEKWGMDFELGLLCQEETYVKQKSVIRTPLLKRKFRHFKT